MDKPRKPMSVADALFLSGAQVCLGVAAVILLRSRVNGFARAAKAQELTETIGKSMLPSVPAGKRVLGTMTWSGRGSGPLVRFEPGSLTAQEVAALRAALVDTWGARSGQTSLPANADGGSLTTHFDWKR
jgi:hypothetical protein